MTKNNLKIEDELFENHSKLILEDGRELVADLYFDCTGFKSLLLNETLKVPFKSFNNKLLNNKAWAVQIPYINKREQLKPYTNCTALSSGWVWNVPVWHRIEIGRAHV